MMVAKRRRRRNRNRNNKIDSSYANMTSDSFLTSLKEKNNLKNIEKNESITRGFFETNMGENESEDNYDSNIPFKNTGSHSDNNYNNTRKNSNFSNIYDNNNTNNNNENINSGSKKERNDLFISTISPLPVRPDSSPFNISMTRIMPGSGTETLDSRFNADNNDNYKNKSYFNNNDLNQNKSNFDNKIDTENAGGNIKTEGTSVQRSSLHFLKSSSKQTEKLKISNDKKTRKNSNSVINSMNYNNSARRRSSVGLVLANIDFSKLIDKTNNDDKNKKNDNKNKDNSQNIANKNDNKNKINNDNISNVNPNDYSDTDSCPSDENDDINSKISTIKTKNSNSNIKNTNNYNYNSYKKNDNNNNDGYNDYNDFDNNNSNYTDNDYDHNEFNPYIPSIPSFITSTLCNFSNSSSNYNSNFKFHAKFELNDFKNFPTYASVDDFASTRLPVVIRIPIWSQNNTNNNDNNQNNDQKNKNKNKVKPRAVYNNTPLNVRYAHVAKEAKVGQKKEEKLSNNFGTLKGNASDRFDAVIFAFHDTVHLLHMFRR